MRYLFSFQSERFFLFSSCAYFIFYFSFRFKSAIFSCSSLFVLIFLLKLSSLFEKDYKTLSSFFEAQSCLDYSYPYSYLSQSLIIFNYSHLLETRSSYFSQFSVFLFKSVFSFCNRAISWEAFSIASYIMPPSDSFFLFISIINVIYMSLDFHTKIQSLTNQLQSITTPQKKDIDIEDVKSSLKKMLDEIGKELFRTHKRVQKIESHMVKRLRNSRRQDAIFKDVRSQKQQKVEQMIGKWVEEYEQKAEEAISILEREERSYNLKLQQEQEILMKQLRIQQNKSKDLIHILQRQLNKLHTLHNQNTAAINQEVNITKISISNSALQTQQLLQERADEVERRLIRIRQNLSARSSMVREQASYKSSKLKRLMGLVLQIV